MAMVSNKHNWGAPPCRYVYVYIYKPSVEIYFILYKMIQTIHLYEQQNHRIYKPHIHIYIYIHISTVEYIHLNIYGILLIPQDALEACASADQALQQAEVAAEEAQRRFDQARVEGRGKLWRDIKIPLIARTWIV